MNKENELTQLLVHYVALQELLEKDTVNLDAVNVKLKQIANIRSESKSIEIKSSEDRKEKLNPALLEIFKKIRSMDTLMGLPPFSLVM